jgi:ribosome-associated heat shock protein Hsp15
MTTERQRIDKWLWHARVVRTRTNAAELVTKGHVRLNGSRVDSASQAVRSGDVLTIALDRRVRVLKVVRFAERRGDAVQAAVLFEDLTPPQALPDENVGIAVRDHGTGRPTKRDRRVWSRITDKSGY